jgi:molybdate transport system substrate-binding protein
MRITMTIMLLGSLLCAARAEAAEIKVLSAGAVRAVVTEVARIFANETGHSVKGTFGTVGVVRGKLASGEPADVVIATDVAIDEMSRQGLVVAGTRTDIARAGVGVGVREGAPRPDISTPEAFKQTLLTAKSIVYVDPAQGATSGIHFASVLQRLGIADQVKDKSILWPGGYAAEAVQKGQAEIVVHQISEILPVKGVTLVGPLPAELQKVTIYSAGLAAKAATPEAARAFIAFLTSPPIKEKFAAAGLDYREALLEPTRIVWNNPRDPQLARFQDTSASCYAEADAAYPPSGASGPRSPDSQRQQYWFNCMKTKGYEPREVSGR